MLASIESQRRAWASETGHPKGQHTFDKIQHMGYLVDDLDKAVAWFKNGFWAERAGGGLVQSSRAVHGGGRNAFVHFGQVEAELIEPGDTSTLKRSPTARPMFVKSIQKSVTAAIGAPFQGYC